MVFPASIRIVEASQPRYRTQAEYTASLRQAVYGLWAGNLSMDSFVDSFTSSVYAGLTSAWFSGARAAGIERDEMTDAEVQELTASVFLQMQYIAGFGDFILANSKANEKLLSLSTARMGLWASRYSEFYTRGYMMAKRNQKMVWGLGATDKHCGSCVKLDGKVKRASQWTEAGIWPKCPQLECRGYNCQCTLTPTTAPMSKGKLPRLP
jgi:hypothetical protein